MQRIIRNVPPEQVNFTVNVMKSSGFTNIAVRQDNGTFTIAASTDAPAGSRGTNGGTEDDDEVISAGISLDAASFMVGKESFVPFRYQDIADNATIGYGHHRGLSKDQIDSQFPAGLTEKEAWKLFLADCKDFADDVKGKLTRQLDQHQFDALVMIAFHRGNANAEIRLANDARDQEVASTIASLRTVNGAFHSGIAKRSKATADLYLHGLYPKPAKTRTELRKSGIALIKRLFPDKLNTHGNKLGRPTEDSQRTQAREALFRMTQEVV